MNNRLRGCFAGIQVFVAFLGLSCGLARAADTGTDASTALGAYFCQTAQDALRQPHLTDPLFRQALSLLEAACRCDPDEPRYFRLLAEAQLKIGNTDAALAALTSLRKLTPEDRQAQLDIIDIYYSRMQTLDQQIAYLRDLLTREVVPPEIRAIGATRCANLLLERGQNSQAAAMIDQAIKLDPINPTALVLRYQMLPGSATSAQKAAALVEIARANPTQFLIDPFLPDPLERTKLRPVARILANELASAGLTTQAITWYEHAIRVYLGKRTPLPPDLALDYASELLISAPRTSTTQPASPQIITAQNVLDQLIAANPKDYSALILRLLIEDRKPGKPLSDKLRIQASDALLNHLAGLRVAMGVKNAATRPATNPALGVPDLTADVQLFRAADADTQNAYLKTIREAAWFEVFFNKQPQDAKKLLAQFISLSPANDLTTDTLAARVEGWVFLVEGNKLDEAKVKLSGAAARDPMAALGMLQTFPQTPEGKLQAKEAATRLLTGYPTGPVGAVLADAVRDLGVAVTPLPHAAQLEQAMSRLPRDWMRILDRPQLFYNLRAQCQKVSYAYGEPLVATVTLYNSSEYELTIGPDGIITPGLWFDAEVSSGMNRLLVNGTCIENITGQFRLKPKQSVTQTVRLDQPKHKEQPDQPTLPDVLKANRIATLSISASVRTNPQMEQHENRIIYSPGSATGGYTSNFSRMIERVGFQAGNPQVRQKMLAAATTGSGAERIRNIEMLAVSANELRSQADPQLKTASQELLTKLKQSASDPDPAIRAWASLYVALLAATPADKTAMAQQMLADQAWQVRLLGAMAATELPAPEQPKILAESAASEPQPWLRQYSVAALELAKLQPATQPVKPR